MKVLVTGGAGFIGSFIVDELVRRGHEVIIFDSLDPQVHPDGRPPEYLNKNAMFVQGDVRNRDALFKALGKCEVVFHEAGAVGVGQSQYEIARFVDVNIGGTAVLTDILANEKHNVGKLIVAASKSSYGEGNYRCDKCGVVRPRLRSPEDVAPGRTDSRSLQRRLRYPCERHTVGRNAGQALRQGYRAACDEQVPQRRHSPLLF